MAKLGRRLIATPRLRLRQWPRSGGSTRGVLLPETERNSPTKSIRHKKPQSRWFVEGWMRLTADIFGTHARRKCSENRDGPLFLRAVWSLPNTRQRVSMSSKARVFNYGTLSRIETASA